MPVRGRCRYCGDSCMWGQGADGKPIARAPDGSRFPCSKRESAGDADPYCEPETPGDRMTRELAQERGRRRVSGIPMPRKRR